MTYSVTGNNSNAAVCRARLQVGGATGTYLDLNAGDTLTCEGLTMSRSEFAGMVTYSVNVPYVVGKTYTVVLSRPGEGDYSSTVELPSAIAGNVPIALTSYQKGSTISPTWTPSANGSDAMYIDLSYNYTNGSRMTLKSDAAPENGNGIVFDATDTQVSPPGPAGNWAGTMTFTRSRSGTMSGSLSGVISASQSVAVTIELRD